LSGTEYKTVYYDSDFKERLTVDGVAVAYFQGGVSYYEPESDEFIRFYWQVDSDFNETISDVRVGNSSWHLPVIYENVWVSDWVSGTMKSGIKQYPSENVLYFEDVPEFDGAREFAANRCSEGYICVQMESASYSDFSAVVDSDLNVICPPTNEFLFDSGYGVIYEKCRFVNGLCPAYSEEREAWGYINPEGEWMIEPQFADASVFAEGYASVTKKGVSIDNNGSCTVIDTKGNDCWTK